MTKFIAENKIIENVFLKLIILIIRIHSAQFFGRRRSIFASQRFTIHSLVVEEQSGP